LWDKRAIQEGLVLVEKAFYMRQLGPYQIQAAISALHASAPTAEATDWSQIAGLYTELHRHVDSAIIQLNHVVAVSMAIGPKEGLRLLEPLADELRTFAPFHLAHADLLRRSDQTELAREAYRVALDLAQNKAERDFIVEQIATLDERQ
jgi:RNA polymerase sigma-70 factor (ECF subfamily)